MVNYTKKAIHSVGIVAVTLILASVFSYLTRIVFARSLEPEEYGLFFAIFEFIMFFLIFRNVGLTSAVTKFIAEAAVKKEYGKVKTLILSATVFQLLSSTILVIALAIASSFLSTYYFKSPIAFNLLFFFMILIYTSLIAGINGSILMGFQDVKWYSVSEPIRLGSTLLFSILFFWLGFGIFAPVLGHIAGSLVDFITSIVGLIKYRFILQYPMAEFWLTTKQLFKFGIPVIFSGFGNKIISHFDTLMLTAMVSLRAVGVYNVLLPTAMMLLFPGRTIGLVLFPMISELWGKQDKKRIAEGLRLLYTYSFAASVPVLFFVSVFAKELLQLMFGTDYSTAILAFQVLLLGILFCIIAIINDMALSGIGKPKTVTKIIFAAAAVNIIGNVLLIPHFKLTGAAAATTASYLTMLVLSTIMLVKTTQITAPWKTWMKIMTAGAIFTVVLTLIKLIPIYLGVQMALSVAIAGTIYCALLFFMRIIDIKEIKKIIKRITL